MTDRRLGKPDRRPRVLHRDPLVRMILLVVGVILAVVSVFLVVNRRDINAKTSAKQVEHTAKKVTKQEAGKIEQKLGPQVEDANQKAAATAAQLAALSARLAETDRQLATLRATLDDLKQQQVIIERRVTIVPTPVPVPVPVPSPTPPAPEPPPCRLPLAKLCLLPG